MSSSSNMTSSTRSTSAPPPTSPSTAARRRRTARSARPSTRSPTRTAFVKSARSGWSARASRASRFDEKSVNAELFDRSHTFAFMRRFCTFSLCWILFLNLGFYANKGDLINRFSYPKCWSHASLGYRARHRTFYLRSRVSIRYSFLAMQVVKRSFCFLPLAPRPLLPPVILVEGEKRSRQFCWSQSNYFRSKKSNA